MVMDALCAHPEREKIFASLIIRMTNTSGISMCGGQFTDTLPGADATQPLAAYVYPFPQIAGGAVTTVIASDGEEEYLLLVRKVDENIWGLAAGYMSPRTPFNKQGLYVESTEHRHIYDCQFLKGGPEATKSNPVAINYITKDSLEYDKSLKDTAIRELFEETGVKAESWQLQFVRTATQVRDRACPIGTQHEQQQVDSYLLDLRARKSLPKFEPGSDIEECRWVKLRTIKLQADGSALADEMYIFPSAVGEIEAALRFMRKHEIETFGVTWERVSVFMSTPRPRSELDATAMHWHKTFLEVAATMQRVLAHHAGRRKVKRQPQPSKGILRKVAGRTLSQPKSRPLHC